jgi:hypothetical protein
MAPVFSTAGAREGMPLKAAAGTRWSEAAGMANADVGDL